MHQKTTEYIPALKYHWLTDFFDPVLSITMPERKFKSDLIESGVATIEVYDMMGRNISVLAEGKYFETGEHKFTLNEKYYSDGLYFMKVTIGTGSSVKKFIVR